MSVHKKLQRMTGSESDAEKLYIVLMSDTYKSNNYRWSDLGEGMQSISTLVIDYWKQRYLLDHNRKIALEIMDAQQYWVRFSIDDVDWETLKGLPDEAIEQARSMSAYFPSFIRQFENGVAEVSWQLIPDGRYWMDDDGFGMTDDMETPVYGMVDKDLNVLVKFRFIKDDYDQFAQMREEAEHKLKRI